jgi:hypothetical protein
MSSYINSELGYYEGDKINYLDLEVPRRPGPDFIWNEGWVVKEETSEQIISRLEAALDRKLDQVAKDCRYESIRTMVTYATSEHPIFGREGRAAVKYRDYVYNYGIEKIYACTREVDPEPIPTEAELLDGLPPFEDFLEPLAA